MPQLYDRDFMKARFIWMQPYDAPTISQGSGVRFGIAPLALNDASPLQVNFGTPVSYVTDLCLNESTSAIHISDATGNFGTGISASYQTGDFLGLRIERNTTADNDATACVWLLGVKLQFKKSNAASEW